MVCVEDLRKQFATKKGPVVALDGVSFTANPGQVFGLLGVNGAGKTTCLRILSTVITSDSGRASVGGFDVATQAEDVRRNIGFLSNSTAVYNRLNAIEVLRYFGKLYGMSGPSLEERIEYVVEKLNIGDYRQQLCDKLSTGQKQRIGIARAILHDPPILFFDEPTAGLDVVTAQTVMEFIEEYKSQGKTIIFSTHIMSEVERLCDQLAVIHDGTIKAHGTVDELKALTGKPTLESAFLNLVGYLREVA